MWWGYEALTDDNIHVQTVSVLPNNTKHEQQIRREVTISNVSNTFRWSNIMNKSALKTSAFYDR